MQSNAQSAALNRENWGQGPRGIVFVWSLKDVLCFQCLFDASFVRFAHCSSFSTVAGHRAMGNVDCVGLRFLSVLGPCESQAAALLLLWVALSPQAYDPGSATMRLARIGNLPTKDIALTEGASACTPQGHSTNIRKHRK